MLSIKKTGQSFYRAAVSTLAHDGIEYAGYLSFLGLLTIFPFLVFMVSLAGFLGQSEAGQTFVALTFTYLPPDFISAIKPRVIEIVSGPPQSLFTIAVVAALWTTSSGVEAIRMILNRAYQVNTPPAYIWRRLLSIGQTLIFTMAIFISMFVLVLLPIIWNEVERFLGMERYLNPVWNLLRYAGSIVIIALTVALSYYVLPNIKQRFTSVLPGAIFVVVGWVVAGIGFSVYLQRFAQMDLVYGGLEGVIVALLFFYIMMVVYIYGAELNYQMEKALGHKVIEKEQGGKNSFPSKDTSHIKSGIKKRAPRHKKA